MRVYTQLTQEQRYPIYTVKGNNLVYEESVHKKWIYRPSGQLLHLRPYTSTTP
jgi:hypothetical protein